MKQPEMIAGKTRFDSIRNEDIRETLQVFIIRKFPIF